MTILAQLPTDRESYHAFLIDLGAETRALLFGATATTTVFRCPTNGRMYVDDTPHVSCGAVWARCYWCDVHGHVRGEPGFDRDHGQPHAYVLMEGENDDRRDTV